MYQPRFGGVFSCLDDRSKTAISPAFAKQPVSFQRKKSQVLINKTVVGEPLLKTRINV